MRHLNLSERRDSFKKQEAVQEVSFDEPDAEGAPWRPPVPHIAVQGDPEWERGTPGALPKEEGVRCSRREGQQPQTGSFPDVGPQFP
uniref:Uncharacterized protein n=1 Tax=Podarcis muralis TaxID=64176 RepID=A0A670KEM0_PODMU